MYPDIARAHGLAVELIARYDIAGPPVDIVGLARKLNISLISTKFRDNIAHSIRAVFTPETHNIHFNTNLDTPEFFVTIARLIGVHLLYPHNTDEYFNAVWAHPNNPRRPEDDILDAFVSYLLIDRIQLEYFYRNEESIEPLPGIFLVPMSWIAYALSSISV